MFPKSLTSTGSGSSIQIPSDDPELPIALRKESRECTKYPIPKLRDYHLLKTEVSSTKHPMCNFVSYDKLCPKFKNFTVSLDTHCLPMNIEEALNNQKWKKTVDDEMTALIKNNT